MISITEATIILWLWHAGAPKGMETVQEQACYDHHLPCLVVLETREKGRGNVTKEQANDLFIRSNNLFDFDI